jgi:hypothetical protein
MDQCGHSNGAGHPVKAYRKLDQSHQTRPQRKCIEPSFFNPGLGAASRWGPLSPPTKRMKPNLPSKVLDEEVADATLPVDMRCPYHTALKQSDEKRRLKMSKRVRIPRRHYRPTRARDGWWKDEPTTPEEEKNHPHIDNIPGLVMLKNDDSINPSDKNDNKGMDLWEIDMDSSPEHQAGEDTKDKSLAEIMPDNESIATETLSGEDSDATVPMSPGY